MIAPAKREIARPEENEKPPRPETPEWAEKNYRRAELIYKELGDGLNEDERVELEELQQLADAVLATYAPPPLRDWKQLAQLDGGGEGSFRTMSE